VAANNPRQAIIAFWRGLFGWRQTATQLFSKLFTRLTQSAVFAFGRMVFDFRRRARKIEHRRSAGTMLPFVLSAFEGRNLL
jgi:hypothetical protein